MSVSGFFGRGHDIVTKEEGNRKNQELKPKASLCCFILYDFL